MLLALRSLWERARTCYGAGLLLSLSSLVNECASSEENADVSFPITGVGADPQAGEITFADDASSGGALLRFQIAQQLGARPKRKVSFRIKGAAADPQAGEITEVAISLPVEGASANPHAGASKVVHVTFGIEAAPRAHSYAGNIRGAHTGFQVVGASASPESCELEDIETPFDLLEEEWLGLMLAAAA